MICAPPRTGKTVLLQQMAAVISANHPEIYMMVLLVDERPEEVTEMRRTVHGEVVASSNDSDIKSHVRIARLMIERSKRLVECGRPGKTRSVSLKPGRSGLTSSFILKPSAFFLN